MISSAWGTDTELDTIVVTATRVASQPRLPVSIDRVDQRGLASGSSRSISESLITVPGVSVQSEKLCPGPAALGADSAHAQFGVRGLRLYSDGIPGTMPDGQGAISQFDLGVRGSKVLHDRSLR